MVYTFIQFRLKVLLLPTRPAVTLKVAEIKILAMMWFYYV